MIEEDKITAKQGAGLLVEYGEIAVAVRCRPGPQRQVPVPEIEPECAIDQKRGRQNAHLVNQIVTHDPAKGIDVELPAHSQSSRQIPVADEAGSISRKCCIAKDMIRMAVRIYDVPDRLFRMRANSGEQLFTLAQAASRVDHRDRVAADDEPDIGDGAFVFPGHQRGRAGVHKNPGRDFADRQRALLFLRERRPGQHRGGGEDK